MGQDTHDRPDGSKVVYEHLESHVRGQIQNWIQDLLEEEVQDLLGRQKHERREAVDAPSGYRNGHGKPRRLSLSSGTITVRRPRVRDLEERFESRILPLFLRRTREVGTCSPSCIYTVCRRVTSTWRCVVCWAMALLCLRVPSRG